MQSLEDIPTWFADATGLNLATAQILLSIILILAVLLPVMYLNRGRRGIVIEIFMFFLVEGALVGMGWLPFWILIVTLTLAAMAVALLGTKVIIGG
jgi:hypothetical protein